MTWYNGAKAYGTSLFALRPVVDPTYTSGFCASDILPSRRSWRRVFMRMIIESPQRVGSVLMMKGGLRDISG